MTQTCLLTKSKARLQLINTFSDAEYNWLFLPGGPGLGSESLTGLAEILNLPGTAWYLDLPGDGSNHTGDDAGDFAHWSAALIEAASALPNTILVAHSTGGMYALATPALKDILKGLVLMSSAPNTLWQQYFGQHVSENPLVGTAQLSEVYEKNPSNEALKQLTIACAPYYSMPKSKNQIVSLFETLPFNYPIHLWSENNFDKTYQAQWIPETLPTLIFAGDQDHITPLKFFTEMNDFKRDNIMIREIKDASHFPWFDNPAEVKKVFEKFCQNLR